ncbi:hypothetical protein MLD38_008752 [Melastoma candidum]|uniref:Uncharacterized protein n=1 Tax=Melastoma candidum TaxID=119954 RepID=A0ACB9RX91_9MYRT|nr:hypothetical protein MLD38_008752 [Melastoma candidum]
MKRSAGEAGFDSVSSMANCLVLLSRGYGYAPSSDDSSGYSNRVFECKTCNRQFPSFQALGGHRASHKKVKTDEAVNELATTDGPFPPTKPPKTHECSICGLEFSVGQALGGHMRRHRTAAMDVNDISSSRNSNNNNNSNTIKLALLKGEPGVGQRVTPVPVVRKSSGRRVLWLDLNLTPTENDSKVDMVRTPTTPVFCYL